MTVEATPTWILHMGLRLLGLGPIAYGIFLLWRLPLRTPAVHLWTLFSLGAAAYLILPHLLLYAPVLFTPFYLLACLALYFLWLFSRSVFRDERSISPWHLLAMCFLMGVDYVAFFQVPTAFFSQWSTVGEVLSFLFPQSFSILLIVLILREAYRGRQGDLVESRNAFRPYFLVALSLTALLVVVPELVAKASAWEGSFFDVLSSLVITLLFFYVAHNLSHHRASLVELSPPTSSSPPPLGPKVFKELNVLISEKQIFLESDLTLRSLSERLGQPEYRLRAHINRDLGFRNFNQFINHYRVEEARKVLSRPNPPPILNLSLDLGFGSLASFNRVFKAETGLSPTQFHRQTQEKPIKD